MNNENLTRGVATQFRSGEEAARSGQKGGVLSGEARRERKKLRQRLLECGEALVTTEQGEQIESETAIAIEIVRRATAGDLKAIRLYAEITGQLVHKYETQDVPPPAIAHIFLDR